MSTLSLVQSKLEVDNIHNPSVRSQQQGERRNVINQCVELKYKYIIY